MQIKDDEKFLFVISSRSGRKMELLNNKKRVMRRYLNEISGGERNAMKSCSDAEQLLRYWMKLTLDIDAQVVSKGVNACVVNILVLWLLRFINVCWIILRLMWSYIMMDERVVASGGPISCSFGAGRLWSGWRTWFDYQEESSQPFFCQKR